MSLILPMFTEKILKAAINQNIKEEAPRIHNLVRLAELSQVKFSQAQLDLLAEINVFNIKGRYDDYKQTLRKQATKEYTSTYHTKSTQLYLWIKKRIQK